MARTLVDGALELFAALAAGVGSVILTALGILAEQAGLQNLAIGNLPIGTWETGMGVAILFVGIYLLGYDQFYRRLRRLASQ